MIPWRKNQMEMRWRNTNQSHFREALDERDLLQAVISVIRRLGELWQTHVSTDAKLLWENLLHIKS